MWFGSRCEVASAFESSASLVPHPNEFGLLRLPCSDFRISSPALCVRSGQTDFWKYTNMFQRNDLHWVNGRRDDEVRIPEGFNHQLRCAPKGAGLEINQADQDGDQNIIARIVSKAPLSL